MSYRQVTLMDTTDYEGVDEWILNIFDDGPAGSSVDPAHEFQGTFADCVAAAAVYVSNYKLIQHRVVLMRVM